MESKKMIYIAGALLLMGQTTVTPIVSAVSNSVSVHAIQPTDFPKGNFQGDFTVDAQNPTVNSGQSANFNVYLKSTGAVTKLSNVDLKIQLPKQDYVEFTQSVDSLQLNGVTPVYDKDTGILSWHFDTLEPGQINKTVLRLDTVNGGFATRTPINVSASLSADSDKGPVKAQTGSSTEVQGSKSMSLVNKFKSIYNNDSSSENYHTNPAIDDDILYNVDVGAPKKTDGSIFLKPGSKMKVTYKIAPELEYVEMADPSLPQPTLSSDKHTLTWEITVPSIEEQISNQGNFLNQDLSMKLHVINDKNNVFKDATNTLNAEAEFNDGQTFNAQEVDGKITISQSDPTTLPPLVGKGGYTSPHYGPIDAFGDTTSKAGQFPDISVNDDALLGFEILPGSLWAASPDVDFLAYTIHYNVDPHLNITKFYTGNFAFHPNVSQGSSSTPLKNQPHYSFNVRYDDDESDHPNTSSDNVGTTVDPTTGEKVSYTDAHRNNWHTLMADVPLGTWLTADQLHIPKGKHVKEVMLHFHPAAGAKLEGWDNKLHAVDGDEHGLSKYYEVDQAGGAGIGEVDAGDFDYLNNWAPAGMSANQDLKFDMKPEKGYVGHVQNSMWINFRGGEAPDSSGNEYATWQASEYDWNHKWSKWSKSSGPQGAEIVKKTEGVNKVLGTNVKIDNLSKLPDGSQTLTEGNNTVTTSIVNTETSKAEVPGLLTSYVLLPKGIEYIGDVEGGQKVSSLVSKDYKNTGRELVKVSYVQGYLKLGESATATFAVNVTSKVSSDPELNVYSFTGTDDFSVPEVKGNPVITDTIKTTDKDNMNGNGTDKNVFESGKDYHFDKSFSLSVQDTIDGSKQTVKKLAGDKAKYQLKLKNTSEDDLHNMILMDTIPAVNDLSITTNEARGSQFNMALTGPVTLSKDWSDKVNVMYTTTSNPKKAGILDKDTIYPSSAQKLTDASGAQDANWVSAKDVKDWSSIKAFKIELNNKEEWVSGKDMAINFEMSVPKDAKINNLAYNSFAFAANSSQVIEPYRQAVEVKDNESTNPSGPNNNNPSDPNIPNGGNTNGSGTSSNNNGSNGSWALNNNGSNKLNNSNNKSNLTSKNNKSLKGKLPQTGSQDIPGVIGLLVLIIMAVGYFIFRNKRKEQ